MSHVTQLNNSRELAARIFPQESELYFRVAERPAGWLNKRTGEWVTIPEKKNLVREAAGGGRWLATVGQNWKMITAKEVFPAIEQELVQVVQPKHLHGVQVRDKQAYGGRDLFREYLFPNMQVEMGSGTVSRSSSVAFRIITWLTYGYGSVKMVAGAVDFACDNGIVTGSVERHTKRHTSGLSVSGITKWVKDMIDQFWRSSQQWQEWQGMHVSKLQWQDIADELVKQGHISEQRRRWLDERVQIEAENRCNSSLWEVYSALTNWATHSDIRETGNDHSAVTRIRRETEASKLMTHVTKLYGEAA